MTVLHGFQRQEYLMNVMVLGTTPITNEVMVLEK